MAWSLWPWEPQLWLWWRWSTFHFTFDDGIWACSCRFENAIFSDGIRITAAKQYKHRTCSRISNGAMSIYTFRILGELKLYQLQFKKHRVRLLPRWDQRHFDFEKRWRILTVARWFWRDTRGSYHTRARAIRWRSNKTPYQWSYTWQWRGKQSRNNSQVDRETNHKASWQSRAKTANNTKHCERRLIHDWNIIWWRREMAKGYDGAMPYHLLPWRHMLLLLSKLTKVRVKKEIKVSVIFRNWAWEHWWKWRHGAWWISLRHITRYMKNWFKNLWII